MGYAAEFFGIFQSQWDYQMVNISRILLFLTWHRFDESGWNGTCKIPKKIFVNLVQIYPFRRLKDQWLCQPPVLSATIITQNIAKNIFSSILSLYKLPIPICGEIIQLNKRIIFGSQPPSEHILWRKWWLTLKSSQLWGLFLTSIK